MNFKTNVVELAAFKSTIGISALGENGQKISAENTGAENGNGPETASLPQLPMVLPDQGSGETQHPASKKKKPVKAKPKGKAKPASVTDVPSPNGHLYDAEHLKGMELKAAYPMTYSSWKNRKNACKKKGWPWAAAWEKFPGFLKSMGPRPSADHTLDRIDNTIHAYGPGLCQWATKLQQNNNKGDNIAIVDPATGEIWTSHKLTKKHKVQLATIYKWRADSWTDLELIAGKKDPTLAKVDEVLKKNGLVAPPKGVKAPEKKINIASIPRPDDWRNWREIDMAFQEDHEDDEPEVFEQLRDERWERRKAEYENVVSRAQAYNAGLPPPTKSSREFYTKTPTVNFLQPASPPLPAQLKSHCGDEQDDDFDPTDDAAQD